MQEAVDWEEAFQGMFQVSRAWKAVCESAPFPPRQQAIFTIVPFWSLVVKAIFTQLRHALGKDWLLSFTPSQLPASFVGCPQIAVLDGRAETGA